MSQKPTAIEKAIAEIEAEIKTGIVSRSKKLRNRARKVAKAHKRQKKLSAKEIEEWAWKLARDTAQLND